LKNFLKMPLVHIKSGAVLDNFLFFRTALFIIKKTINGPFIYGHDIAV